MPSKEYSRGYNAGRRHSEQLLNDMRQKIAELRSNQLTKQEKVYLHCLSMVLEQCGDGRWKVEGHTVDNAQKYCKLAKSFADQSLKEMGY